MAKSTTKTANTTSTFKAFNPTKLAVYRGLLKLNATKSSSAVDAESVANTNPEAISVRDVRHYCKYAIDKGFMKAADLEEVRGKAYYLTATGKKELAKAEKAAKSA